MRTVIVIPTYNERENLEALVERIVTLALPNFEILIVDDNSPDGTGAVADQLATRYPLRVLHRTKKEGLGAAYVAGFTAALAQPVDIIVQMDADGSHDPADIPRLITPIEQGADLVIGSRRVPGGRVIGWGPYRHATSFCAQWFARRILGFRTRDITAGFRAWRAETLRSAIADL